jgi:secondary thiamine-phosphate synthase enzyme
MSNTETLTIKTKGKRELQDVTDQIRTLVEDSGINEGIVHLFVPHTTAGVTINENADPDVKDDVLKGLRDAFPNQTSFRHMEGNSDAHLMSSVVGCDQSVIITEGSLLLGTWQGIYFAEFDGPRTRKLHVRISSHA